MDESLEISEAIFELLRKQPGQPAKAIAGHLESDPKSVNRALYGPLKDSVWQDSKYRWFLKSNAPTKRPAPETGTPDSTLAHLSRYYLNCLGLEKQNGVSVFARSNHGLDYAEIEKLPDGGAELDPVDQDAFRQLLGRVRRDRGRQTIYFGYPIRLRAHVARSGWRGYFLEPIFLVPFEMDSGDRSAAPRLSDDLPILNVAALRAFEDSGDVMNEIVQLEEELGLNGPVDESPDLAEITLRLKQIRPEWDWAEEIEPETLGNDPAIDEIEQPGILNRAVVVLAERSPFTVGLEAELQQLTKISRSAVEGTVLGHWLNERPLEVPFQGDSGELLEVLPMNSEQREAVQNALTKQLTVITGPPGTGKSQVVTNLLLNAAWGGQKVLFASKNNKAVDVVETRVNNLSARPVLLRLGSNQYQSRLAEYLSELLGSKASSDDVQAFEELNDIHKSLVAELGKLNAEQIRVIDSRNLVDDLEQEAEITREKLSAEAFQALKTIEVSQVERAAKSVRAHASAATRSEQSLFARAFWPLIRKGRFKALEDEVLRNETAIVQLELKHPNAIASDHSAEEWNAFAATFVERASIAQNARSYFDALETLQMSRSLEDLARSKADLNQRMAGNSEKLWDAWVRLQPSKLKREDRELLGRYSAVLRMITQARENEQIDRKVWRQYYQMLGNVAHLLPCWAVTSLSARGKVPFSEGMFDLVVIDEASQCDIASALPLLFRAKRAAIIGDPMQLTHISSLTSYQDQQLLIKHDLLDTHVHWGYAEQSLFALAQTIVDPESLVNLRDHHRSHADIIGFSNKHFYAGRLRVATRYNNLKSFAATGPTIRWMNISGNVRRPGNGGAINQAEATAVIRVLRHLVLDQGYKGTVGVVSPFRAQANRIRELAFADEELMRPLVEQEFLVDTVHKFQGDERDVMIFSPVVSEGMTRGGLGFLRNSGNLFNVAITRARAGLVVVGDRAQCANSTVSYLEEFTRYCERLGEEKAREESAQIEELGPRYPAVADPSVVSDWERILYGALYQAGVRPIPQYQIEQYSLDFAVIHKDQRLNVEVDGERYHRSWDGELLRRDQIRNQRMMELGWDVMRFWVYEVRDDLDGCVSRVVDWLHTVRDVS